MVSEQFLFPTTVNLTKLQCRTSLLSAFYCQELRTRQCLCAGRQISVRAAFYAEMFCLEQLYVKFSLKRLIFHQSSSPGTATKAAFGELGWDRNMDFVLLQQVTQGVPHSKEFRILGNDIEKTVTWHYSLVRTGLSEVWGCALCLGDCTRIPQFEHHSVKCINWSHCSAEKQG